MKLIAYNVKTGMGAFECQECEHLTNKRRRIVRRCVKCGHTDAMHKHTSYQWRKRRVGYSRLIPIEQIKQAKASIYNATRQGMRFKTYRTFAGLKIIVEIEMPYKSDPGVFI